MNRISSCQPAFHVVQGTEGPNVVGNAPPDDEEDLAEEDAEADLDADDSEEDLTTAQIAANKQAADDFKVCSILCARPVSSCCQRNGCLGHSLRLQRLCVQHDVLQCNYRQQVCPSHASFSLSCSLLGPAGWMWLQLWCVVSVDHACSPAVDTTRLVCSTRGRQVCCMAGRCLHPGRAYLSTLLRVFAAECLCAHSPADKDGG